MWLATQLHLSYTIFLVQTANSFKSMKFIASCLQIECKVVGANLLSVLEPLLSCKLIRVIFYVVLQKVKEACQSIPGRTWNAEER